MVYLTNEANVHNILERKASIKYRLILDSLLVGVLAGVVIVAYRFLASYFSNIFVSIYEKGTDKPILVPGIIITLALLAAIVNYMVNSEPMISGSGIPQVEGKIKRKLSYGWLRVLVYKFIGGIICLAVGMSVGREGPSIQMGSCTGEMVSEKSKKLDGEKKYLITSGASAGLAAAFGAPLAGVMFALEEVHKNFSPLILMSAMVSATTADFLTKNFFGLDPSLSFNRLLKLPLKYYLAYIVLGIAVGISGYLFNHGIMYSKKIYSRLKITSYFKIYFAFLFTALISMTLPELSGGGNNIIVLFKTAHFLPITILSLLLVKYLFTFVCFGSGVPGGIFFPLLAIGALVGSFVGTVAVNYFHIPSVYLLNFVVLAMAGHFASTVKAPITGIILIFEMTGSFEQLLPLSVVVFISMIVSDALKVDPIYESLLANIIEKNPSAYMAQKDEKTIMEFSINVDSHCAGKKVSEVKWPDNVLLVSIYRDNKEILPRGNTVFMEGDMVTVLTDQSDSPEVVNFMETVTETKL